MCVCVCVYVDGHLERCLRRIIRHGDCARTRGHLHDMCPIAPDLEGHTYKRTL